MNHGIQIQSDYNYSAPLDLSTVNRPRSNLFERYMLSDSNPVSFHQHQQQQQHHRSPYHSINTNSSPMTISTTSPSPLTVYSGESELTLTRSERESPLREIPRNDDPSIATERRKRRNLQAKKIRDAQKHRKIQLESEIRYLEIRNGILHSRVRRLIQQKTALQNAILRERLSRMPHISE